MVRSRLTPPWSRRIPTRFARWLVRGVVMACGVVLIAFVVRGETRRLALRHLFQASSANVDQRSAFARLTEDASESVRGGNVLRDLVGPYRSLRDFSLTCAMTDEVAVSLSQFPELASLVVYDFPNDATCRRIANSLPDLEELWLEEADITDVGLARLGKLRKLRRLSITSSTVRGGPDWELCPGFTGQGFDAWAQPHPLEKLDIRHSPHFNDAGLLILSRFPKLKYLDVGLCDLEWRWPHNENSESWPYFDPPVFPELEELYMNNHSPQNDPTGLEEMQIEFLRVQPKLKTVEPDGLVEKMRRTPPRKADD